MAPSKPWLWVIAFCIFVLSLLLGGWISGFRFAVQPNPLSMIEAPPPGSSGGAELKPPIQEFRNCDARPLSGSALLLSCGNRSEIVILDAVRTMPPGSLLGEGAVKALAAAIDKSPVDCVPGRIGYNCSTRGFNLTDVLVAVGLGVTNDPARFEVERRAMLTGQGLWWDLPPSDREGVELNPPTAAQAIEWRANTDANSGQAEVARAGRAQAFATFFTGVVSFLVGGLLGFILTTSRAERKARAQKDVISSNFDQTEQMLSTHVNHINHTLWDKNADQLYDDWREFDGIYKEHEKYCSSIRKRIGRGKSELGFEEFVGLVTKFSSLPKLHAELSRCFEGFEPGSPQSCESLQSLRQEIKNHIDDYEKDEGRRRA